jgi:hypothetical protein
MAGDGRCHRFDFSGKLLEILNELPGRDIGQNDSATHNPARFRRLVPDGFLKSDVCERYDDIAMYEADPGNLVREQLPFVKRVFQWGFLLRIFGHRNLLWPP